MRVLCTIWIFGSICFVLAPDSAAQSLKQGIQGQVYRIPGAADSLAKENPDAGLQCIVHIYELTTLDQASHKNGVFKSVPTNLVVTIATKVDGSFKVKLPPGTYSVFVDLGDALFANLFKNNQINPVVVKPKQFAWVTISIDDLGL